jgi:microcin C transport system substrate-binding protein
MGMTVFRAAMAPVAAAMLWVGGMLAAPAETVIRAHGVSTFGELKYPEGFAHFDYVNPDAPKGGTFSTWAFGTFDSLSPYILKGNAAIGSSIFFESLMTGTLDEPDSMYGLLAHSVEYPPGREWAIFHLRPEARFSDGTPVTAQDVVFSFNVLLEKGQPAYKVVLKDILSVEAIDDLTVKYTFDPAGALREALLTAAGLPVFSRAYYETRDFAESTLEPPVGSGPYLLGEVKPGQSVSYVLRPDYWGVNLNVNIGTNNFERLSFEYFADYTAAFEAFKGGAYAFRAEFSSLTWATGYDFPALGHAGLLVQPAPADLRRSARASGARDGVQLRMVERATLLWPL